MTDNKNKPEKPAQDSLQTELPKAYIHGIQFYTGTQSIHDRLKWLRQDSGLTLEALSLVTKGVDPDGKGISRVSLSRYESSSEPALREIKILSWAFRRPLAFIVYGQSEDPVSTGHHEPLDLVIEDIVANTVLAILEKKGLIKKERATESLNYENLLDAAKKLAK